MNCSIHMAKVILAGASGMIGKAIKEQLSSRGHSFIQLSTSTDDPSKGIYRWDSEDTTNSRNLLKEDWLHDCQAVINLSGVSIAGKRWTANRKKQIIESRTKSTKTIINWLEQNKSATQLVNASAIGFYGNRPDEVVDEGSKSGEGFMASVCKQWEDAALSYTGQVSVVRIGVVLGKGSGFLDSIVSPARYAGLISLGSGKQVISWIHVQDVANLFIDLALGTLPTGIYNGVAPHPISLNHMIQSISDHTGIFKWPFNVPAFALNLALGEQAEVVLMGNDVNSEKLTESGFQFKAQHIQQALHTIYHE